MSKILLTIGLKLLPYFFAALVGGGIIWTLHDYQEKLVIADSVQTINRQQEAYIDEIARVERQRRLNEQRRKEIVEETPQEWLESPADNPLVNALERLRGKS